MSHRQWEEGDPQLGSQQHTRSPQTPPLSLSLFDPGCPAQACSEPACRVMPHCLSPLSASSVHRSHLMSNSLQHLLPNSSTYSGAVFRTTQTCTIRWVCREAGKLNGVIYCSTHLLSSFNPHPNAPVPGQQGEACSKLLAASSSIAARHAGSSCPAGQAGWEGKSWGKILWQAEKAQPQNTHTHTHKLRSQPSEQKRVSMPRARLFSSLFPARSSELTGSAFIPPRRAAHGNRRGGERESNEIQT